MVPTVKLSEEDERIKKAIIEFVQENNGKVDLLDISNGLSRKYGFYHLRVRDWVVLLTNDGVLEDGPSRMITIGTGNRNE